MNYNELLKKIEQGLFWLDANARHAIELQETFDFPAHDASIWALIKGTRKVRCYKVCLDAIYFEFVMTLMRMYDSYERDTICFKRLFEYLSDDFVKDFQAKTRRKVEAEIQFAGKEFKSLNGSHLVGQLRKVRNNMFAHTSTDFSRSQVAKYGHAEKLLERTLPMLNDLNSSIGGKAEPYDKIRENWKKYAMEFWQNLLSKDG